MVAVSTCGMTTASQAPAPPPTPPGKAGGPSCPRSRMGGSTHTSLQGVADGGVSPSPQGLGTNLLGMKRAGGGKGGGGRQREQQKEGGGGREMGTGTIPGQWVRSRDGEPGWDLPPPDAAQPRAFTETFLTFPCWRYHGKDPQTQEGSAGCSQDSGRAAGPGVAPLHPQLPLCSGDTALRPLRAPRAPCSPQGHTFVPDQVMSQHDEEAEQQEDDDSHHPANHRVVGAGGRGHRAGVCPGREREKTEGAEILQGSRGCCCSPQGLHPVPAAPSC